MVKFFACSIISLTWAAALYGAPLDRRQLPADVKWFLHIDADAGRTSKVGSAVLDAMRGDPGATRALAKFREVFNADPTKDIHGITVYGTDFIPEAGVLVVRGKLDREKIIAVMQKASGFNGENYRSHPFYSWNENGPQQSGRRSTGAFFDSETIVLGSGESAVKHALDLMDGIMPPVTSTDSPLAKPGPAGSIVEAGVVGLDAASGLPVESPVLRQCDYGLFSAGEHNSMAFVSGVAMMRSPEVAEKVCTLVQGTRALALLNGTGEDSDVARLLSPLKVRNDDRAVRVDWNMPAEKVADLVVGVLDDAIGLARPKGPETKP